MSFYVKYVFFTITLTIERSGVMKKMLTCLAAILIALGLAYFPRTTLAVILLLALGAELYFSDVGLWFQSRWIPRKRKIIVFATCASVSILALVFGFIFCPTLTLGLIFLAVISIFAWMLLQVLILRARENRCDLAYTFAKIQEGSDCPVGIITGQLE